jgi:hypothetical protein
MIQLVYLMPKSPAFPEPRTQPYVGGIIGTNILCIILHLYFACPQAGEATRGYLHGGLLLDFIGQQGPSSKLHLVVLDLVILFFQLTGLAATMKQKELIKWNAKVAQQAANTSNSRDQSSMSDRTVHDYDAEERGESRRVHGLPTIFEFMQMNDSGPSVTPGAPAREHYWAFADLLSSGTAMIAELFIVDTVRQQHIAYNEYRATSGVDSLRFNLGYELNIPFRS